MAWVFVCFKGFVCGGGYEYPKGGNNFPHPGGQYPPYPVPHPGGQYRPNPVHPGPVYPPTGPNYPFPGYPGGPHVRPPSTKQFVIFYIRICIKYLDFWITNSLLIIDS